MSTKTPEKKVRKKKTAEITITMPRGSWIMPEPETVALFAYNTWENTGREDAVTNWLEAEKFLLNCI